jgi:cell pole-organizing protein PopZ
MLKPLLKEWLDAHLPSIVHAIVTQQVEKIVQRVK